MIMSSSSLNLEEVKDVSLCDETREDERAANGLERLATTVQPREEPS